MRVIYTSYWVTHTSDIYNFKSHQFGYEEHVHTIVEYVHKMYDMRNNYHTIAMISSLKSWLQFRLLMDLF